ncbi:MAG: hypothetical protein ACK40O_12985 [Allosphingosinicella sp.]
MSESRTIAMIGAVLILLGVFLPLFTVPFFGSVTYFENSRGAALVLIALALGAAALAATQRTRHVAWIGLAALGVMIGTFIRARARLEEMREGLGDGLRGDLLRAIADRAVDAVRPQWGWAVLALGAAMLVFAGVAAWRAGRD